MTRGRRARSGRFIGYRPFLRDGKAKYNADVGGSALHVSTSDVPSHLKMAFTGTLDVHDSR